MARASLAIALLFACLGNLACGSETAPLSVVVITLDTTRADALGAGEPIREL